jgi:hypothetical protein
MFAEFRLQLRNVVSLGIMKFLKIRLVFIFTLGTYFVINKIVVVFVRVTLTDANHKQLLKTA